jgi:hypothetical protein
MRTQALIFSGAMNAQSSVALVVEPWIEDQTFANEFLIRSD